MDLSEKWMFKTGLQRHVKIAMDKAIAHVERNPHLDLADVLKADVKMETQRFITQERLKKQSFGGYNPSTNRWMSVDPLADHPKQIGMSPYSAFANNPIRYVDPTGMIWEDPKQAERLNNSINKRIEKIDNKSAKIQSKIDKGGLSDKKLARLEGKLSENSQKTELLNQSLGDIEAIGNASETFKLGRPSSSDGTHGVAKGSDGVITIEGSNIGLHIHEIRHVGQSIEAGGVKFNKDGKLLNSATTLEGGRNNEVNAYQTQYSYDGSYPGSASSLKGINSKYLMQIKTEDGKIVYKALKDKK